MSRILKYCEKKIKEFVDEISCNHGYPLDDSDMLKDLDSKTLMNIDSDPLLSTFIFMYYEGEYILFESILEVTLWSVLVYVLNRDANIKYEFIDSSELVLNINNKIIDLENFKKWIPLDSMESEREDLAGLFGSKVEDLYCCVIDNKSITKVFSNIP